VRAVRRGDAIVESVPNDQGKEVFALAGAYVIVMLDEPK